MANIRIVTGVLYIEKEKRISIGGVETYIRTLNNLLNKEGHNVTVYQFSNEKFEMMIDGIRIVGTGIQRTKTVRKDMKKMIKVVTECSDCEKDILVFAADGLVVKNQFRHSVAIQHGIDWDVTVNQPVSDLMNTIAVIKSISKNLKAHFRMTRCKNIVCVDYNFLNWYRAHVKRVNNNVYVIPNFVDIIPYKEKNENTQVSIIFARRFVEYRGTRLFAEAIDEILKKHPDISVTMAGVGPDEQYLRKKFKGKDNVVFTTFMPYESLEIHKQFDIAVVPTIGSEGTSLSLLEAMSAGCAVIATNVGGMTNIVLDEFNGLMISPQKNQLVNALDKLIIDSEFRKELAKNAHMTVMAAFSKQKWEKSWKKVFDDILNS